jgi:hypothetical protein
MSGHPHPFTSPSGGFACDADSRIGVIRRLEAQADMEAIQTILERPAPGVPLQQAVRRRALAALMKQSTRYNHA